ncbi:MAG UNVERIFIED_CONTAM: hypothetical protein LVR18_14405 [Planctomycetaceae bacterium]
MLNVTGNLLLIAVDGGSITVAEAGMVTVGSVTFQTSGTVLIAEDDGMLVAGSSTAGSLTLISSTQVSNAPFSSVVVDQNALLRAPNIELGYSLGDSIHFGSLTLDSTGTVRIIEDSGLNLTGTSTVAVLAELTATGTNPDLTITDTLQTTSGTLLLKANRDILFAASAQVLSNSGPVTLTADATATGNFASGAISMLDGAVLNAGSGLVVMTAPGNISVSSVASTSEVRITSAQGGILDNGDEHVDLIGGSFALRSLLGIGSTNALETSVSTLAWLNSGAGEVRIEETDGLTVGPVNGLTSASSTGAVSLSTGSGLVYAMDTIQASLLSLSRGSSAAGEDITVNNGVTVRTTTGNLVFQAADRIVVIENATVRANSTEVILRSGLGDSDSNGGMQLDGTIQATAVDGRVTLSIHDQQPVTQNATTGAILTTNLRLMSNSAATASFALLAASRNDVDVLAANTSGAVTYRDIDDLTIGSIAASSGIAAMNGISTVNSVSEGAAVSVIVSGALTANQPIRTSPTAGPGSLNVGTVVLQSLNSTMSLTDNADIFADGPVTLTAAAGIQTAGEVTTSNDNVLYASAVILTGAVSIDTGSGGGDITFDQTVNGGHDLTLTAGTGNIDFNAAVGLTDRIAQLRIVSVTNAMFDAALLVQKFLQNAGSGTTTFTGVLNTDSADGVDITGTNLRVISGITTTGNGQVLVVLSGSTPNGMAVFENGRTRTRMGLFPSRHREDSEPVAIF